MTSTINLLVLVICNRLLKCNAMKFQEICCTFVAKNDNML